MVDKMRLDLDRSNPNTYTFGSMYNFEKFADMALAKWIDGGVKRISVYYTTLDARSA